MHTLQREMWVTRVAIAYFLIEGSLVAALPSNPSIVIVGSGPSGIAAATRLLKSNFTNVKILEAENRIGGRINSVQFGDGDAYVDLGAEFCHGEKGNIVYSMVKDFDILKHSENEFILYHSNGDDINETTAEKLMNFAKAFASDDEPMKGCEELLSVGDCLDVKFKTFPDEAQNAKEKIIFSGAPDWANSYISAYDSPLDLHDLKITTEFHECEGDNGMNWNGHGYKTILEVMMQKYPNKKDQLPIDDKILLEKVVTNISNWLKGDRVAITTADGSSYEADHVIVTPSVGVLKATHQRLFSPPLPDQKVDAIENIGFGAILKVILRFNERWWREDAAWAFIWTPEDKEKLKEKKLEWLIDVTGFAQAENNPNVIISWFSGSHVPLIEGLPVMDILEGHKYLMNTFLAPHFNVSLPFELIRTTWYSNPNFRGTYSYESVKGYSTGGTDFQEKLGTPLANKDGKPTVLFAGEATHPYYFSTVHGAIETGYREADRLIELYKN